MTTPPGADTGYAMTWERVFGLIAALGTIGALIFTGVTVQQGRSQLKVSERGQVTDRYLRAVEQLGSKDSSVRLGAVYALGRLATESPEDAPQIGAILTGYVRDHIGTRSPVYASAFTTPTHPVEKFRPPGRRGRLLDVEGSLAILQKIPRATDDPIDLSNLDFHDLILRRVDFHGANLDGANFSGSLLTFANFQDATLTSTDFQYAQMNGAILAKANLSLASLRFANLTQAHMEGANMENTEGAHTLFLGTYLKGSVMNDSQYPYADFSQADLSGTILTHSDMSGADLSGANLTKASLDGADFRGAKSCDPKICRAKS